MQHKCEECGRAIFTPGPVIGEIDESCAVYEESDGRRLCLGCHEDDPAVS